MLASVGPGVGRGRVRLMPRPVPSDDTTAALTAWRAGLFPDHRGRRCARCWPSPGRPVVKKEARWREWWLSGAVGRWGPPGLRDDVTAVLVTGVSIVMAVIHRRGRRVPPTPLLGVPAVLGDGPGRDRDRAVRGRGGPRRRSRPTTRRPAGWSLEATLLRGRRRQVPRRPGGCAGGSPGGSGQEMDPSGHRTCGPPPPRSQSSSQAVFGGGPSCANRRDLVAGLFSPGPRTGPAVRALAASAIVWTLVRLPSPAWPARWRLSLRPSGALSGAGGNPWQPRIDSSRDFLVGGGDGVPDSIFSSST